MFESLGVIPAIETWKLLGAIESWAQTLPKGREAQAAREGLCLRLRMVPAETRPWVHIVTPI